MTQAAEDTVHTLYMYFYFLGYKAPKIANTHTHGCNEATKTMYAMQSTRLMVASYPGSFGGGPKEPGYG